MTIATFPPTMLHVLHPTVMCPIIVAEPGRASIVISTDNPSRALGSILDLLGGRAPNDRC
jgi:hypothetical protein